MRRMLLATIAAVMIVPSGAARAAETTITLTAENTFTPASASVPVGGTVMFVWSAGFHNVKFDDGPRSGEPLNLAGNTWSRTFTAAGTYRFICEVHAPAMTGTITVAATGDGAQKPMTSAKPKTATSVKGQRVAAPRAYAVTGSGPSVLPVAGAGLIAAGTAWSIVGRRRRRR